MKKGIVITAICLVVVLAFLVGGQIFTVRHVNVVFNNKTGLTTESEILSAVGLDKNNNIFSINERSLKKKVTDRFTDNSIVISDVVRSFPDTVTLYVRERAPVFLLKVYSPTGDERYVPTDKDFQRGTVYEASDISPDLKLIEVEGFEVVDTFDVPQLTLLRSIANLFLSFGLEESALPYFIDKVVYEESSLSVVLASGARFVINATADAVKDVYDEYVALPEAQRFNKIFYVGVSLTD